MRLQITTPLEVVVDEDAIVALSAEDASGAFGIQPHHADFLTSLAVSVLSWKGAGSARRYCAVRGGVLTVTAGREIAVATREAVTGDDLVTLERIILDRFHIDAETERTERVDAMRVQLNAIRRIVSLLRPGVTGGAGAFS